MRVAVFGSSDPAPGSPGYDEALELGGLLARAGHTVVTGGYGGVMEAASRGAREAGGATLGITCGIFSDRLPNRYLDEEVSTPDLHLRTRSLIDAADGFVVARGKAGTLAELGFLWALQRAGCLGPRRVILLGGFWAGLLADLEDHGVLEQAQTGSMIVVETPAAAVAALSNDDEDGESP